MRYWQCFYLNCCYIYWYFPRRRKQINKNWLSCTPLAISTYLLYHQRESCDRWSTSGYFFSRPTDTCFWWFTPSSRKNKSKLLPSLRRLITYKDLILVREVSVNTAHLLPHWEKRIFLLPPKRSIVKILKSKKLHRRAKSDRFICLKRESDECKIWNN